MVFSRKHIPAHDHLSGEMASIRAAKHQRLQWRSTKKSYCLVLQIFCANVEMSFTDLEAGCKLAMAFPLADEVLNLAKATLGLRWDSTLKILGESPCPWRKTHRFFVEHVIEKAKLA